MRCAVRRGGDDAVRCGCDAVRCGSDAVHCGSDAVRCGCDAVCCGGDVVRACPPGPPYSRVLLSKNWTDLKGWELSRR